MIVWAASGLAGLAILGLHHYRRKMRDLVAILYATECENKDLQSELRWMSRRVKEQEAILVAYRSSPLTSPTPTRPLHTRMKELTDQFRKMGYAANEATEMMVEALVPALEEEAALQQQGITYVIQEAEEP